jgi:hypothetical protein
MTKLSVLRFRAPLVALALEKKTGELVSSTIVNRRAFLQELPTTIWRRNSFFKDASSRTTQKKDFVGF